MQALKKLLRSVGNSALLSTSNVKKNNACYRDIDFEIHIDLLSGRRTCLDGLDLSTTDDEPLDPKSVKRVRVGL